MNDAEFFAEMLEQRDLFVMLGSLRKRGFDITLGYNSPLGIPELKNRYSCEITLLKIRKAPKPRSRQLGGRRHSWTPSVPPTKKPSNKGSSDSISLMGVGNIHIGKDIWTWRGHNNGIEIRDPRGQKILVSYARLQGLEDGDDVRSTTPRDIRQFIEEVLLAPPDDIKCLTCYGKGQRPAAVGRFVKCAVCGGLGRWEPTEVPKW